VRRELDPLWARAQGKALRALGTTAWADAQRRLTRLHHNAVRQRRLGRDGRRGSRARSRRASGAKGAKTARTVGAESHANSALVRPARLTSAAEGAIVAHGAGVVKAKERGRDTTERRRELE